MSAGLHEKHVVATWNVGNHLSICFIGTGIPSNNCVEMAGRRTFRILTSIQNSGIKKKKAMPIQYNKYT